MKAKFWIASAAALVLGTAGFAQAAGGDKEHEGMEGQQTEEILIPAPGEATAGTEETRVPMEGEEGMQDPGLQQDEVIQEDLAPEEGATGAEESDGMNY